MRTICVLSEHKHIFYVLRNILSFVPPEVYFILAFLHQRLLERIDIFV